MRRPGLRVKVTAMFAAGALVISVSMALLSYELTSRSLLAGRDRAAMRATYIDASVVQAGLATDGSDIVDILRSLDTGGNRRAVLRRDGIWYARSADVGVTAAVPESLLRLVESGQPGSQRVRTPSGAAIVVGIPLSGSTSLFEIDSLNELEQSLQVLALVLTLVAAGTTGAGAGLGWYTTRRVLRPLASVTAAAQEITAGDFSTRLDPAVEPELERLTTSFNRMVDQLAQRLDRDRRFAADVSHELRSPLQTLAAAASVLSNRTSHLDERTASALRLVVDEVRRFQNLVTDLLELARGDQTPQLASVDMAQLCRQVCRSRAVPTDLVRVDTGANPVWRVDRRRFEQVLGNLLDNAQRHGGGARSVRIGNTDGLAFLEVDDEGPGVSPQDRVVIFDRFVRGSPARARGDGGGTGLGLALVAQHVTSHGGRVMVTDRPGGGARFRVEMPLRP